MNKLKEFLSGDKKRVMIIAIICICVLLAGVIAFALHGRSGKINEQKNTTKKIEKAEKSNEKDSDEQTEEITTLQDEETIALEDATVDEEIGNIDDEVADAPEVVKDALPYQIRVNRAANCITVYEKDKDGNYTKPFKAIVCSSGKYVGDTPLGTFKTKISYEWLLMVDGSYGQFAYRYYGSILFHSVPYFSKNKGNLEYKEFNKLGEPASLGCVRVCVRDAIWLIENCPVGTEVIVYDDAENPGPLGKPEMIKIPEDSENRGWDPTDPDPANPWNQCSPKITVDEVVTVAVNKYSMDTIVERIGATAVDTCGNDITDRIKAGGSVNFKKTGKNTLVLTVKDAIGRTDTKIITLNVEDTEVTTAKPTTTKKETTKAPETTSAHQEGTTAQPTQPATTTPAATEKPTQPATTKPTQPATTKPQETTKLTVSLGFAQNEITMKAGAYASLQEVLQVMGCNAVYSDGRTVKDASSATKLVSGRYYLNQAGTYTIQVRYTDAQGISSQDCTIKITVRTSVVLQAERTEVEVSAGEYQSVTDVLTKLGLQATDSAGNAMNISGNVNYTGDIDLNTAGDYKLTLTVTDSYGETSAPLEVTIHVIGS